MSRPVARRAGSLNHGRTSAALAQDDYTVLAYLAGEVWTLTRLYCTCGQSVGILRWVNPGSGGRERLMAEVQAVDCIDTTPVGAQTIRTPVADIPILADCTAHGRVTFSADQLTNRAVHDLIALNSGLTNMGRITVAPTGFPWAMTWSPPAGPLWILEVG